MAAIGQEFVSRLQILACKLQENGNNIKNYDTVFMNLISDCGQLEPISYPPHSANATVVMN